MKVYLLSFLIFDKQAKQSTVCSLRRLWAWPFWDRLHTAQYEFATWDSRHSPLTVADQGVGRLWPPRAGPHRQSWLVTNDYRQNADYRNTEAEIVLAQQKLRNISLKVFKKAILTAAIAENLQFPGLRPGPRWGSLKQSPKLSSWWGGHVALPQEPLLLVTSGFDLSALSSKNV